MQRKNSVLQYVAHHVTWTRAITLVHFSLRHNSAYNKHSFHVTWHIRRTL